MPKDYSYLDNNINIKRILVPALFEIYGQWYMWYKSTELARQSKKTFGDL